MRGKKKSPQRGTSKNSRHRRKRRKPSYCVEAYRVFGPLVIFELYRDDKCFATFIGDDQLHNDKAELKKVIESTCRLARIGEGVSWS